MPSRAPRNSQFHTLLWACLAIYWCLLLLAIHWPMPFHPNEFVTGDDKIVHFALYGVLALLLSPVIDFAFPGWPRWKRAAGVVVVVVLQGICDELTQPLTERTTDVLDLAADFAGAVVAVLVYRAGLWRLVPAGEREATLPE